MTHGFDASAFQQELLAELTGNILPFWMNHAVDHENGGFYGALTNDLIVHDDAPRSAILCTRILWTYAIAYRRLGAPEYLSMANRAYDYLRSVFWDSEYAGVYWEVDRLGRPVSDRKHHYAQAFAIYALAEYHRATGKPDSLTRAKTLYDLLERYAYEPAHGGYIEGSSRSWGALADMRLSDKDLDCRKSMNTMLHTLEAFTGLLQVWDGPRLAARHRMVIELFLEHIIDRQTGHLKLFFDDAWRSLSDVVSFGHDIEASWLLWEAAEASGEPALQAQARDAVLKLAEAVYREGLDADGSLFYEAGPRGLIDDRKHWWPQAEAVVGFYNAYQFSGDARFAEAAHRCWRYIQAHVIDHEHGDWYKRLHRNGTPDESSYKAGPWECPYHHARMCFEMLDRLDSRPAVSP